MTNMSLFRCGSIHSEQGIYYTNYIVNSFSKAEVPEDDLVEPLININIHKQPSIPFSLTQRTQAYARPNF
jgi:hypothetical protein